MVLLWRHFIDIKIFIKEIDEWEKADKKECHVTYIEPMSPWVNTKLFEIYK